MAADQNRNIRRCLALWLIWAVVSIVVGVVIGIIFAFGDTGHVNALSTVLLTTVAGFAFGVTGGFAFGVAYQRFAHEVQRRALLPLLGMFIGAAAGLLGIYFSDILIGIAHATLVGLITGAIVGLVSSLVGEFAFGLTLPRPMERETKLHN